MLMVLTESEHENKLDHLARPRMKKKENFARVRVLKKSEKKNIMKFIMISIFLPGCRRLAVA